MHAAEHAARNTQARRSSRQINLNLQAERTLKIMHIMRVLNFESSNIYKQI